MIAFQVLKENGATEKHPIRPQLPMLLESTTMVHQATSIQTMEALAMSKMETPLVATTTKEIMSMTLVARLQTRSLGQISCLLTNIISPRHPETMSTLAAEEMTGMVAEILDTTR